MANQRKKTVVSIGKYQSVMYVVAINMKAAQAVAYRVMASNSGENNGSHQSIMWRISANSGSGIMAIF